MSAARSGSADRRRRGRNSSDTAILEFGAVAGVVLDERGHISEANEPFLRIAGIERHQLPRPWPGSLSTLRQAGAARLSRFQAAEITRGDGRSVPILLTWVRGDPARGTRVGIVVDTSEHCREQRHLGACEERYRSLYENVPLMYFRMDSEGTVLSVNSFGAEELGYEPHELVGRSVLEVFHEADRPAVREQFESLVRKPGDMVRWEFRKVRKDGSLLWVQENARAVRSPDGDLEVMVACADVTRRKALENQLRDEQRQLRALAAELSQAEEQARRRIARHLHDEIGQTLATVRMNVGELSRTERPADLTAGLHRIVELLDGTIRATRTLTFELASPVLYELGLDAAIGGLCEEMDGRGGTRFIYEAAARQVKLPDAVGITLYRAASELALNVIKHARATTAQVGLEAAGGEVAVSVRDDGAGFDPEAVSEGFSPAGGFGLFNIRERLSAIGGRMEVDSRPGDGCRVVLRVPATRGTVGNP